MGDFNRSDRSTKRPGFGIRSERRGREKFEMHQAICTKCGKSCEVPFKPSGDKPVYCSDCFEKNDTGTRGRDESRFKKSNFNDRPMFQATCDNCKKPCSVPFQPRTGKPIYCSKCFEDRNDRNDKYPQPRSDQYSGQFAALNTKLDKILSILASTDTQQASSEKSVEKVVFSKSKKQRKETDKEKNKEEKEVKPTS